MLPILAKAFAAAKAWYLRQERGLQIFIALAVISTVIAFLARL